MEDSAPLVVLQSLLYDSDSSTNCPVRTLQLTKASHEDTHTLALRTSRSGLTSLFTCSGYGLGGGGVYQPGESLNVDCLTL